MYFSPAPLSASTAVCVNGQPSISKLVILRAAPPRLLGRVLRARRGELAPDDLDRVGVEPVGEQEAVGQHIGELVEHLTALVIRWLAPLEVLEQLRRLDRDRLCEVLGRVELRSLALGDEGAEVLLEAFVGRVSQRIGGGGGCG